MQAQQGEALGRAEEPFHIAFLSGLGRTGPASVRGLRLSFCFDDTPDCTILLIFL